MAQLRSIGTLAAIALMLAAFPVQVRGEADNCYAQRNLVSNNAVFNPQILDPLVKNAWGISLRPAGLGGHFWVANTGTGTSTTYVGDTESTPLFQDELQFVTVASLPVRTARRTVFLAA